MSPRALVLAWHRSGGLAAAHDAQGLGRPGYLSSYIYGLIAKAAGLHVVQQKFV